MAKTDITVKQYKSYLIKHLKTTIKCFEQAKKKSEKEYEEVAASSKNFIQEVTLNMHIFDYARRIEERKALIEYIKQGLIEKWGQETQ